MNPRLKKIIIMGNILAYVVVCLGIYARKKGGFKALLPRKKMSLEEVIAKRKKGEIPAPAGTVVKVPVEKKVAPSPVKPAPAIPVPVKPPSAEIAMTELPPAIRNAKTLLENMKTKEKAMEYGYYPRNRDPFVSLVGIENYLSQTKFTPDEYAELPPGLPVKEKQKSSPFTLFGTIKSKEGESSAIINGQVLQEGDIIDSYKVTKIERKSVTLSSGKKVIKLEMLKDETQTETAVLQRLKELKETKQ